MGRFLSIKLIVMLTTFRHIYGQFGITLPPFPGFGINVNLSTNVRTSDFLSFDEKHYMTNEMNEIRKNVQPSASNMIFLDHKEDAPLRELADNFITSCYKSETYHNPGELNGRKYGVVSSATKEGIITLLNNGKSKFNFNNASCPPTDYSCVRYWEVIVAEATHFYCRKGDSNVQNCYVFACALEIGGKEYQQGVKPYKAGRSCSECSQYKEFPRCYEGLCTQGPAIVITLPTITFSGIGRMSPTLSVIIAATSLWILKERWN